MGKENFNHSRFQEFKDISYQTDKDLVENHNRHYSDKGGHKARSEHEKTKNLIQKSEVWLSQKNLYEAKKKEAHERIIFQSK